MFLELERLLNIQHQPFEVLAFGMVDINWVVGWLVQLMQDADFSLCHRSSSKDSHSELVFIDGLRATEGEEDAARLYHLESLGVELRVATQGVAKGIFVFSKGRRVEDDEIIKAFTI